MVIFFLPSGVAIQMTEAVYVAPSLNAELTDVIFLQNLPSIVASYVLDPQPGEIVLDMCAAPGIKHYCTNDNWQTVYHTHMAAESFSSQSDWLREWLTKHVNQWPTSPWRMKEGCVFYKQITH